MRRRKWDDGNGEMEVERWKWGRWKWGNEMGRWEWGDGNDMMEMGR